MLYTLTLNTESVVTVQLVQYEIIRIKVIDCRSGNPLANSKIRRLIIRGKATIDTSFTITSSLINTGNIIKDSQEALKRLGYFTGTPSTAYDNATRTAYNNYWNNRANQEVPQVTTGNPPNDYLSLITTEYNNHYATNNEGVLNVRIPQNFFDGYRVEVEVGLWDCPIILEEIRNDNRSNPIKRTPINTSSVNTGWNPTPTPSPDAPQLIVEWSAQAQSTGWDDDNTNWGWTARINNTTQPQTNWLETNNPPTNATPSQFQYKITLVVKNNTDAFNDNSIIDNENKSVFYDSLSSITPHFVLFALQWCQPVWDGIEDNEDGSEGAITENSYIQDSQYANMNMHLATHYSDLAGTDYNGGKGYGKMEACTIGWATKFRGSTDSNPGHSGFDLYVPIDAPIFAFKGGTAEAITAGTHYKEKLTWTPIVNNAQSTITFLHLSNLGRVQNSHVMAGQIIGRAGRSGNLGWTSILPGHTHLNVGSYPSDSNLDKHYSSKLYETNKNHVDVWNLKVFPNNNLSLVFPCKCQIGTNNPGTGTFFNCNFDNYHAETCWAAMELKCPAMVNRSNAASDSQRIRVIQAQLKVLNYFVGNSCKLDNNTTTLLKNAITYYKQNLSTYPGSNSNFPPITNEGRGSAFANANDTNNTITDLLCYWLNQEVPLPTL